MPRVASLLALVVLLLVGPATARAERWRRPVDGVVVGAFAYAREAPFAAGRRRGIDLRAAPGSVVRAACSGVVRFAGPTPRGRGVTVRCGRLRATHLGLGHVVVRRGAVVVAGARLGTLGPRGVLRLGARVEGDRFGYRDPLVLLGAGGALAPPPVLGPAPRRASRPPRPGSARVLAPPPARPRPASAPAPPAAFAALALVAAGLGLGALATRARRGSRARTRAAAGAGSGEAVVRR
ncbi:peptidoglycan DD-metalloendopeptidase family protein [Conexibacter sp. SYSU D00693]|uniref:peptidoglycan DD-metalloendopeptidase family protein n=1 Tax=Conexibacter sp. SYSU D00693 TaxID=2812560 RepID=UPI00196A4142|nr:peptidoglycan DD-metalloendopeptidase family protein [Conexibacter sp. SYSU D00693]